MHGLQLNLNLINEKGYMNGMGVHDVELEGMFNFVAKIRVIVNGDTIVLLLLFVITPLVECFR